MRKIGFVPLRCGSKSIRFKNIKEFCGKPLCFWNLQALQESLIDEIVVATDCEEIGQVVRSFGFNKIRIYKRDPKNAEDSSSTEEAMLEFIAHSHYKDNDVFMLIQATSPLTQSFDFNNGLNLFEDSKFDSVLSCVRTKRFFWDMNAKALNYDIKKRMRRQDFRGLFMENGAFYINTFGNIKKFKNRLCGKVGIVEMEEYKGIEVDEPLDFEIAQILMQRFQSRRVSVNFTEIKLFASDVDGTLTDGGMYYFDNGIEAKRFSTIDGFGFEVLKKRGVKTALLSGENTELVKNRAKKLQIDYVYLGLSAEQKLQVLEQICAKENIELSQVAYIGDDINCAYALEKVGVKACPKNAHKKIKEIPNIIHLQKRGGFGAVREFIDLILCRD